MGKLFSPQYVALFGLAAATGLANGGHSIGQESERVVEEIVVTSPFRGRPEERASEPIYESTVVELTRRVKVTDLDLAKHSDVTALRERVETAAREACQKLAEMYPFDGSRLNEIRRCMKRAVERTQDQIEKAIAAAE